MPPNEVCKKFRYLIYRDIRKDRKAMAHLWNLTEIFSMNLKQWLEMNCSLIYSFSALSKTEHIYV